MPRGEGYNPTPEDYKKAEESMDKKEELMTEIREEGNKRLTDYEKELLLKTNLKETSWNHFGPEIAETIDGHSVKMEHESNAFTKITIDGLEINRGEHWNQKGHLGLEEEQYDKLQDRIMTLFSTQDTEGQKRTAERMIQNHSNIESTQTSEKNGDVEDARGFINNILAG